MYSYEYPHPALTTDCIVFGFDGSEDAGTDSDTDWYYIDDGEPKRADASFDVKPGQKSDLATYDEDGAVYTARIKVPSEKMGKFYFCFNEMGQMQTGLQYIAAENGFYYFDDNGYPVDGKVSDVECDDDSYAFRFETKNGHNGKGIQGEKDNYLYFNAESMVMAGITQVADFAADNSHINLGEGGVDAVWPHISLETVSKDSNLVEQARENLKYQLYIFANSAMLNISTQRVNTWWDTALTVTTYASSILAVLFFLAWVVLTLLPEKKPVVVRVENKR